MSTITPISTPPARPGSVPLRPATPEAPTAPPDRVDLAEAADVPSRVLLVAAVALAVAAAGAIVGGLPAGPATLSQSQPAKVLPQPLDHQELKAMAEPGPFDGPSARAARQRYGRLADQALQEATIFTRDSERLARAAELRTERAGESYTVTETDGRLVVREELVEGAVTTLEVGPEGISVSRAGTTRQVTKDGTFRVTGPDGTLEVSGASLRHVTNEVVRGYAGDITIEQEHRFSVPENSLMQYPRTVLTEARTRTEVDSVSGNQVTSRRTVEVRDDGSARLVDDRGGAPEIQEEPSAQGALVHRKAR